MQIQHQNSKRGGVFYIENEGQRSAEITYQHHNLDTIIADHTWVDPSLRGDGVARKMLDVLVEYARENQLKIIPQCSYVAVMFRRDQSLKDVMAHPNE